MSICIGQMSDRSGELSHQNSNEITVYDLRLGVVCTTEFSDYASLAKDVLSRDLRMCNLSYDVQVANAEKTPQEITPKCCDRIVCFPA